MNRLASPAELRASLLRWALFLIPAIMLLGWLSGYLSGSGADNPWFAALVQPVLMPDPSIFPPSWIVFYFMMGLGMAIVCSSWGARWRSLAIAAFVVQFLLNLAWSPVFFVAHNIPLALGIMFTLLLAAIVTAVFFWKVRRNAGLLMVPYIAWLLFLSVLTVQFMQANPDASGAEEAGAVQRIAL